MIILQKWKHNLLNWRGTGNSIEQIAEALNMPVPSIRGAKHFLCCIKVRLRLFLIHRIKVTAVDPLAALGENIANMTLADIAEKQVNQNVALKLH